MFSRCGPGTAKPVADAKSDDDNRPDARDCALTRYGTLPFEATCFVPERLGLRGLHCGCGRNLQTGWLNTDRLRLTDSKGVSSIPEGIVCLKGGFHYLEHDGTRPFPLPDCCFEWVFAEHFIEHLSLDQAIAWLSEARRLLRPNGLLRLSTPDLSRYIKGYDDPKGEFFAEHRKRLTEMGVRQFSDRRAWMINQIFRFWGHQWIYDLDEIRSTAEAAGFDPASVTECSFRQGAVPEVYQLDLPIRSDESLYVEIRRA